MARKGINHTHQYNTRSRVRHLASHGGKIAKGVGAYLVKKGVEVAGRVGKRIARHAERKVLSYVKHEKKVERARKHNASQSKSLMISQHNDYSTHRVACTHDPKKHLKLKPTGWATVREFQTRVVDAAGSEQDFCYSLVGMQGSFALPAMLTYYQLTGALRPTSQVSSPVAWAIDPWQLDPNNKVTNTTYYQTAAVQTQNSLYVSRIHAEYEFVNPQTTAVEVEFVMYLTKKNGVDAPPRLWAQAIDEIATPQNMSEVSAPNYVGVNANINAQPGQIGYAGVITAGNRPTKQKLFTKFFKEIGYQKFILQGGDSHRLSMDIPIRRVLSRATMEMIKLESANSTYLAGWTIVPMVTVLGAPLMLDPVDAAGNPTGTAQKPTYSSSSVGVLSNYEVKFSFLPAPQGRFQYVEERQLGGNLAAKVTDADDQAYRQYIVDDTDNVNKPKIS